MTPSRQRLRALALAAIFAASFSVRAADAEESNSADAADAKSADGVKPAPEAKAQPAADRKWLRAQPAKHPVASAPTQSPLRLVLFGVLVSALGGFALVQRRKRKVSARAVRSDVEVISTARVGNKAQVVVVSVGGKRLLLGVTEAEVSRLAWLDAEPEALPAEESVEEQDAYAFATPNERAFFERDPYEAEALEPPTEAAYVPREDPEALRSPRKFREVLLGALGQVKKNEAPNAALTLAESTRDVVTRTPAATRRQGAARPQPQAAAPAAAPAMIDVEGQARGLVLRLQKRA